MLYTYHLFQRKNFSMGEFYSNEINHKVYTSLVRHVYQQSTVGLLSSLFCAMVIFIGLFSVHGSNRFLYLWLGIYLIINLLRLYSAQLFKRRQFLEDNIRFWRDVYIIGALLGGSSWGLAAILLFPDATISQQMLMILMLAGVTAGAVSLSSAIPEAVIAFLFFSLVPFIIAIALLAKFVDLLFLTALSLYLIYSIILALKAHDITRSSIILSYENHQLLRDLSEAKTQLELSNKKLEFSATHDPLTQVANRNLFLNQLELALNRAKANKTSLALLYLDLDFFKKVNDIYGHSVGDRVLVLIIERLKNFFKSDDSIARLGGDELTIILENVGGANEINKVAKQLCSLISMPITINETELTLSVSIGISVYPQDGSDVESLLWNADQSMYYVKQRGGNNYHSRLPAEV